MNTENSLDEKLVLSLVFSRPYINYQAAYYGFERNAIEYEILSPLCVRFTYGEHEWYIWIDKWDGEYYYAVTDYDPQGIKGWLAKKIMPPMRYGDYHIALTVVLMSANSWRLDGEQHA